MAFRPIPNSEIIIDNIRYKFTEHPMAKGMPYGQTGRRATIYQLVSNNLSLHALKVFTKAFRSPEYGNSLEAFRQISKIPGMQVCERSIITAAQNQKLIEQFPEIRFAVLMPWVDGETWFDIIFSRKPLTPYTSLEIARALSQTLSALEEKEIAHCDLSGPNLIINTNQVPSIALVDLEEMYSPFMTCPEKLPSGTSGYAHSSVSHGIWEPTADRFSAAILFAEILGWSNANVRMNAYGDHFFSQNNIQQNTERYQLLLSVLKDQWSSKIADLFAQAWESKSLAECPSMLEWKNAIEILIVRSEERLDTSLDEKSLLVNTLLGRASEKEREGNVHGAMVDYQEILKLSQPGDAIFVEAGIILEDIMQKLSVNHLEHLPSWRPLVDHDFDRLRSNPKEQ